MSKKTDHKSAAQDLIKGFINSESKTPMQEQKGNVVTPIEKKLETDKFTVEIEAQLMKSIRKAAFESGKKLRQVFEEGLRLYLEQESRDTANHNPIKP